MRKFLFLSILLLLTGAIVAPFSVAQTATTPYSSSEYYASSFALWSINSQSPNTYIFQGRSLCSSSGQSINFFVFNTNAPVWIADNNTANSEVVTPSAVTNSAGSCGVTVSPLNTHNTFALKSGTGGLQEAINQLSGSLLQPATIILDRNWYAYAAQVPGTTPLNIIAAATGNSNIVLKDITTSPTSYYYWNGSAFAQNGAEAGFPNLTVTSFTQISAPAALSTSATTSGLITTAATGGTIPAATYRLAATYIDASGGETLISTDSASTATIATSGSTSTISVTSPAAATGAVGWRLYVTAASGAAGSEILYAPTCSHAVQQVVFTPTTVCAIGSTATVTAIITGTATVPPTGSAYPRTASSSGMLPPFTALGTVASAATGTLGLINIPAGVLNTLGRQITVCGNGFATNNNTTGTVAFATKLFSVPGVTSITPWTVSYTTATTTAVQVPLNFCVTYTTAATGSSGTIEAHGWLSFTSATAGAGVAGGIVNDNVFTVSSSVDLTRQLQLDFTITPTTTGLTAAQLRQLSIVASK